LNVLALQAHGPGTTSAQAPIEAELLIPVSTRTAVGKPVYVRVLTDWRGSDCTLRTGGILKGRVVATVEHSRNSKNSSIALAFDSAECADRDVSPLALTLVALAVAGPAAENTSPPLNEAVGISIGAGSSTADGGRSATTAALTGSYQLSRDERPARISPGSVIGLRGLKLSVGTGPGGSSVLSQSGQNIRLERGFEFYLVVAAMTSSKPVAAELPAATPSIVAPGNLSVVKPPPAAESGSPSAVAPDETEVCSPPNCSIELANADTIQSAEASISISELGYAPRRLREDYGFNHEAAIAFLGPGELLCTFNPHILVPRTHAESATRVIRAVLIDTKTLRVRRALEWRVPDDRQYLWAVAGNRVLVHVGNQLRFYGPGLKVGGEVSLGAPLAFLKTAPSGKMIVLGILHERHSPEMHRQLLEALGAEPEEDVEVRLLDGDLLPLGSWLHSGNLSAPILSNAGELRFAANPRGERWSIVEYGWNKQRRILATLTSVCRPDMMSLPPNLLLVSGCARMTRERWYRVLGSNGKAILGMSSPPSELTKEPRGSDTGRVFALAFAEPARSMIPGASFSASALLAELVIVYDAHGGKRLLAVRLPDPAASEQTFALSPDGGHLAVLAGGHISFYAIPASMARNTARGR
jgi:hypothetical protein